MEARRISLSEQDLRAVARYAAECARDALEIFERAEGPDTRPRAAIDAAFAFAAGGKRTKSMRDAAWGALRAAGDAGTPAARDAARAAMSAASAGYLHPLTNPTQVRHILGAAAHGARAAELAAEGDASAAAASLERAFLRATPVIIGVLERYPEAPPGGGRVGELMRELDRRLRAASNL